MIWPGTDENQPNLKGGNNSILVLFMRRRILLIISTLIWFTFVIYGQNKEFRPGAIWKDTDGNAINAHGAGFLNYKGIYYWYGEYKGDSTYWNPKVKSWECYRTEAGGVSCYSSHDLYN